MKTRIHIYTEDYIWDNKVSTIIDLPYIPQKGTRIWLSEEVKETLLALMSVDNYAIKRVYNHIKQLDDTTIVYEVAYNMEEELLEICLSTIEEYKES